VSGRSCPHAPPALLCAASRHLGPCVCVCVCVCVCEYRVQALNRGPTVLHHTARIPVCACTDNRRLTVLHHVVRVPARVCVCVCVCRAQFIGGTKR
jgi:hypothetical protein